MKWRPRRVAALALGVAVVFFASLQTDAAERATLGAIDFYRAHGSSVAAHLGARCRFEPTCSRYAEIAVRKYGVVGGLARTSLRIMRCNPLTTAVGTIDEP